MLGMKASEVRARLAFDVERLRGAATRMEEIDAQLSALKRRLEARASHLAADAMRGGGPSEEDGTIQLWRTQAHATAELAGRAALGEVLRSSSRLSLIVAMAVSRWITALRGLSRAKTSETILRSHVEAGRLAHHLLSMLRRRDNLRSGVGQLTSAVVVAEFAHPANGDDVDEQIETGLSRARTARGVHDDEEAIRAASRALRAAATLLEELAESAAPAARSLLAEADRVEGRVADVLRSAQPAEEPGELGAASADPSFGGRPSRARTPHR